MHSFANKSTAKLLILTIHFKKWTFINLMFFFLPPADGLPTPQKTLHFLSFAFSRMFGQFFICHDLLAIFAFHLSESAFQKMRVHPPLFSYIITSLEFAGNLAEHTIFFKMQIQILTSPLPSTTPLRMNTKDLQIFDDIDIQKRQLDISKT